MMSIGPGSGQSRPQSGQWLGSALFPPTTMTRGPSIFLIFAISFFIFFFRYLLMRSATTTANAIDPREKMMSAAKMAQKASFIVAPTSDPPDLRSRAPSWRRDPRGGSADTHPEREASDRERPWPRAARGAGSDS